MEGMGGATDAAMAGAEVAASPSILPQTHFAAAKLFESQGMPNKAITQYRKAIAVNHSFVEAHERLGLLLSRIGRHEEASRTLRQAVGLKPKDPALRNNLGFELLLTGNLAGAEEAFQAAVRMDAGFARAYVNLGIAQSRLGRYEEALESFRIVLPEPDAYYNLALMYRGEGKAAAAVDALRHVLAIDPEFIAAKRQLEQLASQIAAKPTVETWTDAGPITAPGAVSHAVEARPESTREPIEPSAKVNKIVADAEAWEHAVALADEVLKIPEETSPSVTTGTVDVKIGRPIVSAVKPVTPPVEAKESEIKEPISAKRDVVRTDDAVVPAADRRVSATLPAKPTPETEVALPAAIKLTEPAPEPEVMKMLGRRVNVSGFQTHRPDIADQIEILLNDIHCLADAKAGDDARVRGALAAATNVVDKIEPVSVASSAWAQAIGSVGDIDAASVEETTAKLKDAIVTAMDEPCDEALLIDYVPACDPTRVTGEFAAALDPAAPVVYVEEPVERIGFALAAATQPPDGSVFDIRDIACAAVIDTAPARTGIVADASLTIETTPNSSVNRAGVIRYLEGQLTVVRNEIACLEEQEIENATAATFAAGKRGEVRLVAKRDSVPDAGTRKDDPKERTKANRKPASRRPLKATGRAPIVKPQTKKLGRPAADAASATGRTGPTGFSWEKTFDKLDGLACIAANEVRCLSEESRNKEAMNVPSEASPDMKRSLPPGSVRRHQGQGYPPRAND